MTGQPDEIDPTGPRPHNSPPQWPDLTLRVAGSGQYRAAGTVLTPTERASPRYVNSYHRRQP